MHRAVIPSTLFSRREFNDESTDGRVDRVNLYSMMIVSGGAVPLEEFALLHALLFGQEGVKLDLKGG